MKVLHAEGITVCRGDQRVLREVTVSVRAGELVAVVGPNGAGKSTLLAALAGELPCRSGHVRIYDRDVSDCRPEELARLRAVLPQQHVVAFPFRAREVVAMGRAPWQATPAHRDDSRAVAEALRVTESAPLAERRFPTLSGGEQARVALARVLAQATPILLLDEPTAAMDLRHAALTMRLAAQHAAQGGSCLLALHDLTAAAAADRVVLLRDGELAADGPPSQVLDAGLLSRVYDHPIEVLPHPRTGAPIVVSHREAVRPDSTACQPLRAAISTGSHTGENGGA